MPNRAGLFYAFCLLLIAPCNPEDCGCLIPAIVNDSSELTRYLESNASRGSAQIGPITITFRKMDFSTAIATTGKILTVTLVDSKNPGSGQYPDVLRTVESVAKEKGYHYLMIEGVDVPRQWEFYENKMKYQLAPKSHPTNRTYYKVLE